MMMHYQTDRKRPSRTGRAERSANRVSFAARDISNRNSRFTGFRLTASESLLTYFLTATKTAISGFRGLDLRTPCCLRRNALESFDDCIRQFASGQDRFALGARRWLTT